MSKSPIEWTEQTWNPIVGCSIVSPGCTNCYAMRMAARNAAMGISRYDGTTRKVNGNTVWTGKLAQAPVETLLAPLRRKKPTTYFVNSMGDLFHEDVPDAWIDPVFAVMALCPQHTFQVLTKRAGRMRKYFDAGREALHTRWLWAGRATLPITFVGSINGIWPLPNVWLGVSTERQQEADERIPLLLQTPAAVRFISAEPLLGQIDLTRVRAPEDPHTPQKQEWLFDSLSTGDYYEQRFRNSFGDVWYDSGDGPYRETKLDWVIVGGESGPNARPMHPDWARSLRDQCAAAAAFFFKQWGNWHPEIDRDEDDPDWRQPYSSYQEPNFQILNLAGGCGFHGERVHVMRYCSKKSAGRLLDGIEHNAMPVRP